MTCPKSEAFVMIVLLYSDFEVEVVLNCNSDHA